MVTLAELDERLFDLQRRSLWYAEPGAEVVPDTRHLDCYLTWPALVSGQRASTLGPYARWLIAARLVLSTASSADQTLSDVLGVGEAKVRSVLIDLNSALRRRSRYEVLDSDDDVGRPVFERILAELNERFAAMRGKRIEWEDFLHVPVPLFPDLSHIGQWPIEWFAHYLEWGAGTPSRASHRQLLAQPRGELTQLELQLVQAAVRRFNEHKEVPTYKRIINVVAQERPESRGAIARQLAEAIGAERPVIHIDLRPGISRRQVIRQLYTELGLNAQRLDDLDRRAVDLAADLEPVRISLTVGRVVVIADGWDNMDGPLHALHEYLWNANWCELLRILAQPYTKRVVDSGGRLQPQYQLLVISSHAACDLGPWTHTIQSDAEVAPAANEVPVQEAPWYAYVSDEPAEITENEREFLLDMVALRFVAASINGVRLDTLRRCLESWARMFWPTWLAGRAAQRENVFQAQVQRLLKEHAAYITHFQEEELEGLTVSARLWEIERRPYVPSTDEDPSLMARVLTFETRAMRSSFIAEWMRQEQANTSAGKSLPTCSWAHINMVLSEECLKQFTVQLRHLPANGIIDSYEMRRAVHGIYQGLMSLPLTTEHFTLKGVRAAALHEPILPTDANKRYLFIYGLVYRYLIERGEWRLTRSFGRSDLCLDLLAAFVMPRRGPRMLLGDRREGTAALLPAISELGQIPQPLQNDPKLWCDLVRAIGRAGCDLGGENGRRATQWALDLLPGGRNDARVNALLPSRDDGYYRIATDALKLRIDSLLYSGKDAKAEELCLQQFRRLGLDEACFVDLRTRLAALLRLAREDDERGKGATGQMQELLESMRERVSKSARSRRARVDAAGFLFRYGEILAAKVNEDALADKNGGLQTKIDGLAHAGSIFWIADRVRSDAGALGGSDEGWPLAGARAMRNYVRVMIKLARLLAEGQTHTARIKKLINRLLEHAQHRLDVYTRHHCQFRRERNSMLLLEVSRVRSQVRIDLEYEGLKAQRVHEAYERDLRRMLPLAEISPAWHKARDAYFASLATHRPALDFCWQLIDEVENNVLSMGYHPIHVRRILLERIKTMALMMQMEWHRVLRFNRAREVPPEIERKIDAQAQLCAGWLKLLREISEGSPYWLAAARRRRESFKRVLEQWPDRTLKDDE